MKKPKIDREAAKEAAIRYCHDNGLSVEKLRRSCFSCYNNEECTFYSRPKGIEPGSYFKTGIEHPLIPTLTIDMGYRVTESDFAREYLSD